jgi:hypothetical protein
MAIKINVQKSYEEVDIAGKIYIIDLNDDKLKEYTRAFHEFRTEANKLSEKDFVEMSKEEQEAEEKKNYELMEKLGDLLLGEGSFRKVYHDIGKSLMVMAEIIMQLMEVVNSRVENFKNKGKSYYTGK